ncbi:MAG TPA: Holliday junction branch migration protein RuvA [Candidatus Ozemobacteraceae bacterium]
MIEQLRGRLIAKLPHRAVVDWNGLALEALTPFSTFKALAEPGETVTLLCHLHWREEGPQLFGFATEEERSFFRLLTRVNKIGPKLAVNILSAAPVERLVEMIMCEDSRGLTALKGVGPKLASRLVIELKESVAKLGIGMNEDALARAASGASAGGRPLACERDARDALENLGYTGKEIDRALRDAAATLPADADLQTVIEAVLRAFS